MKLSVSVPDELWASARASVSEAADSPSAVVQAALNNLVNDNETGPSYAQRPPGARALLEAARERLLIGAREDYEAGYRTAQAGFASLSWHDLNRFARHQFKLRPAFRDWAEFVFECDTETVPGELSFQLFYQYAREVGHDVIDSSDGDQVKEQTTAFLDGFRDALKDAYEAVARGASFRT